MQIPKNLSPESRRLWKKITGKYAFDDVGFVLLKTALECLDEVSKAKANIDQHGAMIENPETGAIHRNPNIELLKFSRSQFLQAWRLLGLSLEQPVEMGRPSGEGRRKGGFPYDD